MNQFLKKAFFLFVLFSSISVFAQDDTFGKKKAKPFSPKFILGTGFYTLTGDIQSDNTSILKGNSGYNAGMKFELSHNLDLSFLLIKTAFSAENSSENFTSDIDGFGLNLGYTANQLFRQSKISPTFSLGIQRLGINTRDYDRSSAIAIPLGFGLRMNVTNRLEFDVTMNFGTGLGDIDMSQENPEQADGYKSLQFTIYYDLFTPGSKNDDDYFDDSYYADVNFSALDIEDSDGDLVADVDDYCPKTPIGVKVNESGCPLDSDNDGVPNYIDEQKNTPEGSVVDENGVQLTADQYHSMYSDYEAASREYANFYNENEIRRENYKTIDAYLIAKANAFNKAYNEGKDFDNTVAGLKYKVKIGEFIDGVPDKVMNKYLSLDDLESISEDNGVVIYAVGIYNTLDDALGREFELEAKGFNETSILVDNNGEVSNYVVPVSEPVIDEDEIVVDPISEEIEYVEAEFRDESLDINSSSIRQEDGRAEKEEEKVAAPSNETIYRIQIIATKEVLSDAVFKGIENKIEIKGNDGWIRYMAGSFAKYKDAVSYMYQMRARGFEDAFIVTNKNGEWTRLNVAVKTVKKAPKIEVVAEGVVSPNIEFTVQILVAKESLSTEELTKMSNLGNIEKEAEGQEMYRYFAGAYSSLEDANMRLAEAKLAGYTDAFVFASLDGARITLKQAKELLK